MEFKPFSKIERLGKAQMQITEKIHGTNAQITIVESSEPCEMYDPNSGNIVKIPEGTVQITIVESSEPCEMYDPNSGNIVKIPEGTVQINNRHYLFRAGCRTRWVYPTDDNYGFAAWVDTNKEELIEKLGVGTHYGEWAGPGINSGAGLTEKTFVLFDWWRYPAEKPLPPQTKVVPVLYIGSVDLTKIEGIMADLRANGSKLSPGFMRPEGVVVSINGVRYKHVFEAEETQWTKSSGAKNANPKTFVDYSHLLQPVRLEKLLSRDEKYKANYPESLPEIIKEYVADLIAEGQISGDEDQVKAIKKGATGQIFKFIKEVMNGY